MKCLDLLLKKWVEVHDQLGDANDRYNPNKPVRFKTSMLRSDLYDFRDAYIVVKGAITVAGGSNSSRKTRPLAFKNNAPFIDCISNLHNLLEYSKNYSETTCSLWNYYKDELTDDKNDNNTNKNVINTKSFKYKTVITGNTYNVDARIINDAESSQ